jgi:hypothetical protein
VHTGLARLAKEGMAPMDRGEAVQTPAE